MAVNPGSVGCHKQQQMWQRDQGGSEKKVVVFGSEKSLDFLSEGAILNQVEG